MAQELVVVSHRELAVRKDQVPAVIVYAGAPAKTAWRDFFKAVYPNPNTTRSYHTAVRQFCQWCEERGLALTEVRAGDVGVYLAEHTGSISTKKVHRSANKKFFDFLVERHVCLINPWAVARTEKYKVKRGKTERIEIAEVHTLLASIDRQNPVGKRDHTIIALMAGTGVRTHAISKLRRGNYHGQPGGRKLRFLEKGGVDENLPVREDVEQWIDDYLAFFRMKTADKDCPIFRPFIRRQKAFRKWSPKTRGRREQGVFMPNDIGRMVKRRMRQAGLREELSAHSFRVNVITDLIEQKVPIEDIQELVGHADARTTKGYDRTNRPATRNLVERIRLTA